MSDIAVWIEAAGTPDEWRRRIATAWVNGQVVPADAITRLRAERLREALLGLIERYEEIATNHEIGRGLDDAALVLARAALAETEEE